MNLNPTIVAVIASAAACIVSLFVAEYFNQRFIERIFGQQTKALNAKPDQQMKPIDAKLNTFRAEINTLRVEIANLAQRIERIERQLDKIFKPILPGS